MTQHTAQPTGQPFLIRDLMSRDVLTVRPDDDLAAADALMQLKRVRHLPVVAHGKLVGVISHRDVLHARVSSVANLTPREAVMLEKRIAVEQIMQKQPVTVTPDTLVLDAARQLRKHQYGCLPVVEAEALVGIVTESDFVELAIRMLEAM